MCKLLSTLCSSSAFHSLWSSKELLCHAAFIYRSVQLCLHPESCNTEQAELRCVQEPQQKILDIETAVQMLQVVLPESNEHLEPFTRFLKEQSEYKYMNLDQWTSFYRFSEEVSPCATPPPHSEQALSGRERCRLYHYAIDCLQS